MKKNIKAGFVIALCMVMVLVPLGTSFAQGNSENIILAAKAAIDDPFGELGLQRIEKAKAMAKNELAAGSLLRTTLEKNLSDAQISHDTYQELYEIWVILGNAGWQSKYIQAKEKFDQKVTYLRETFGLIGFVENFNFTGQDVDRIYIAFTAVDLAHVDPTPANIADAEAKTKNILNKKVMENLTARITGIKSDNATETIIPPTAPPKKPTSAEIVNSAGIYSESLTLNASALGEKPEGITYGPAGISQKRIITGDLILTGDAKKVNLQNITVKGDLSVDTPDATVTLDSSVTVLGTTAIKDVSVGTFNTKATHDGKVLIQDSNGGSVNFTGSTISEGIEINPTDPGMQPILIRGIKPTAAAGGNADIKITGDNNPKVVLEGEANKVLIEAKNSEFELSVTGNADKITISNLAAGSKIKTSNHYEFELLFKDGDTVSDITSSGLFGDMQIRVVGYPSETENIQDTYILKIDTPNLSVVYTLELDQSLTEGEEGVQKSTDDGLFKVDVDQKRILFKGEVKGKEIRSYLDTANLFDKPLVLSFYNIFGENELLYSSEPVEGYEGSWSPAFSRRVLVGTNDQHGLYILTKVE